MRPARLCLRAGLPDETCVRASERRMLARADGVPHVGAAGWRESVCRLSLLERQCSHKSSSSERSSSPIRESPACKNSTGLFVSAVCGARSHSIRHVEAHGGSGHRPRSVCGKTAWPQAAKCAAQSHMRWWGFHTVVNARRHEVSPQCGSTVSYTAVSRAKPDGLRGWLCK